MLIRSDGIPDFGPGIEGVSVVERAKDKEVLPQTLRVHRSQTVDFDSIEQIRQLFPSQVLARREMEGLSPGPDDIAMLQGRPWISTLLEAGQEVAERFADDPEASALCDVLLEDINNVEILIAYRRILVGG